MQEIVIISGKGGTGKTSIVLAFASITDNIMLADCDVDASNLHVVLCPEEIHKEPIVGSYNAVISKKLCCKCGLCIENCNFNAINTDYDVKQELCEGCGVCEYVCPEKAIHLEPHTAGTLMLSKTRNGLLSHVKMGYGEEGSGKLITAVRSQARKTAKSNGSNIILIDGPPGIGCPTIASVTNTKLAIIVCEPSLSGKWNLERAIELVSQLNVKCAVCINKYDINNTITGEIYDLCESKNVPIIGKIPYDLVMVKAITERKSIIEIDDDTISPIMYDIWEKTMALLQ
ncbi:MAG: ATP-binding protein [Candidatus Methanofastidiosia archaeon]